MSEMLLNAVDDRGVATITLNRADVHNAFDDALIAEIDRTFATLDADPAVRLIVLTAAGSSFSAGADLNWMRRMAGFSQAENEADARALARMLRRIYETTKPTIARVQGAAFGGGVGLVAACDMAIASDKARFSLSEVKLGLSPSTISPYVLAAIGTRAAGRYFVTGERFDAQVALRLGLVHEVTPVDMLDAAVARLIDELLQGGPMAQRVTKTLIREVAGRPIDEALGHDTARRIAALRASPEGREGVGAFLEKRSPNWRPGGG